MNRIIPQYYTYLILFSGDDEDVEPILRVYDSAEMKADNENRMHLFDDRLVPILPAVEYCLHLPRCEMDTCDTETEVLEHAYDVPHDIIIMPDQIFLTHSFPLQPTLIIYLADCSEEVRHKAHSVNTALGAVSVQDLCEKLLKQHWQVLYEKRNRKDDEKLKDIDTQYLLPEDKQLILPALYTARQYGRVDSVYSRIFNTTDIFKTCAGIIWNQRVHHNGLMYCEGFEVEDGEAFKKLYNEGMQKAKQNTRINVVITMPGIPQRQVKYGGLSNRLPGDEKAVIRLVGLHRAIAKEALLIELPMAGRELFQKLDELEINCKKNTNNKYIRKALRDIGEIIERNLTQEQLGVINWAQHITVFSDFPIGLAVFSGGDTSLQCYKEISYRPLSPLTRCFQSEMYKRSQHYLGKRCKIAFAECIPDDEQNKLVRICSDGIIHSLKEMNAKNPNMQVTYRETLSVKDLKQFMADNIDADILHISAHGHYDRRNNMAGILVGDEFWMADESDYKVPSIVVLSACHVSPRGGGCLSIADLFIRVGAEAVLGTFIPVNARRNMFLMNRLYTYIAAAQEGSAQYKTLSEAWSGVVATNAILEMKEASPSFSKWLMGKNADGNARFLDFILNRSVGRLHNRTMYADTIAIIKEMLHEEGLDGKFDDVLSQDNYFPESFFYQWIGFPENVFFYNKIFKEVF